MGLRVTHAKEIETFTTKKDMSPLKKYANTPDVDEAVFDSLNYEYVHIDRSVDPVVDHAPLAGEFKSTKSSTISSRL